MKLKKKLDTAARKGVNAFTNELCVFKAKRALKIAKAYAMKEMANRTDTQADTVHGGNPQYLVDRINRVKIYNDAYWKEFCFGLTTETLIDRAIELDYVGGTYGGRRRPAKFFCLVLKCLQIQPDEDVVMEYIKQSDYKYLRALGCLYLRLTARPLTVFRTLEPFYADYRKLRFRDITGKISIIHMDEFIDWLLREETVCEVTMPGLPKREVLEDVDRLEPRASVLDDDLEDLDNLLELDAAAEKTSAAEGKLVAPADDDRTATGAVTMRGTDARNEPSPSQGGEEPRRRGALPRARSASPQPRSPRRSRSARRAGRSPRARSPSSEMKDRRRGRTAPSRSASPRSRSRSQSARVRRERKEKKEKIEKKDKREEKKEPEVEPKEKREKKEKKKEKKVEKWRVSSGKDAGRRERVSSKAQEQRSVATSGREKDGALSVAESNAIRKSLGLKPLKE